MKNFYDGSDIVCPLNNFKRCMGPMCAWWTHPFDVITGTTGEDRCAIAMIAGELNDISNTEMGAERL